MEKTANKLLLYNGKIWQWRNESCTATWCTVNLDDGCIIGVGSDPAPPARLDGGGQRVDLEGRCVLPGLIDNHLHMALLGQASMECALGGTTSLDELSTRVAAYAEANPNVPNIIGGGWNHLEMGNRMPTRQLLDSVVPDRPVGLARICVHIVACNTAALQAAGVWDNREMLESDEVELDSDGVPTGIVKEKTAFRIMDMLRQCSPEAQEQHIRKGMQICLQNGTTAVHTNDNEAWAAYKRLAADNALKLRVFLTAYYPELEKGLIPESPASSGPLLHCGRLKVVQDGSLGGQTAALSVPYNGSEKKGMLFWTNEELTSMFSHAKAKGYPVEVHAIGDRAARSVLDSFVECGLGPEDKPYLTHCQILDKGVIDDMARLGVVANIQPSMLVSDMPMLNSSIPASLHGHAYVWKTLMKSGVSCAGGSDAPVESQSPLSGMYDAIYRSSKPNDPNCFKPEECLTFAEALALYTTGGARAIGQPKRLGRIERGYQADLVALDCNVVRNPALLKDAAVDRVWVAGKLQYCRETSST